MIEINCQSSIKISEDKIIYFDPIKQDQLHDADYIFITHPHWDHFSKEDIFKVKKRYNQDYRTKRYRKSLS